VSAGEAVSMIREGAHKLGLDLSKADMEKTRDILSRGTPLSEIVKEMRGRY